MAGDFPGLLQTIRCAMIDRPGADPRYLREHQYRDDQNFNARFELHERFSINPVNYYRWIFDQLDLPTSCVILEIGCGPGYLWLKNRDRLEAGWDITLSDFSPGMLNAARKSFGLTYFLLNFAVIDAGSIALADGSVDVALANHMLYHVRDRAAALGEIHRVLKPGGRLHAATSGRDHLRELGELLRRVDSGLGGDALGGIAAQEFSLENGRDQLAAWFSHVELRRYEDALQVTEVEPLLRWVRSCVGGGAASPSLDRLSGLLMHEIEVKGAIHLSKDTGIFIAVR
jgi:SAM-dependent methyltransferase